MAQRSRILSASEKCTGGRLDGNRIVSKYICILDPIGKLTFYLFFDWFGGVDPVADVVVVGVLQPEVVLLDDVHLVVHLLHELLARRFLLQKDMFFIDRTLIKQKNDT